MPTGYTAAVQDGTITTLHDFAMCCARNFGALVHMRDEPTGAPIPEVIKPSTYHDRNVAILTRQLNRLQAMSPSEAQRECQQAYSQAMARWKCLCDERAMHRVRYQAMLEQVHAWKVPTADHLSIKAFMAKQLTESLDWDCSPDYCQKMPRIMRWSDWLALQIEETKADLLYAANGQHQEVERAASRTEWLQALRTSTRRLEAANA